jgi:hypothetical protein
MDRTVPSFRIALAMEELIECAKQVEQIMAAIGIGKEEIYHHNEPVSN